MGVASRTTDHPSANDEATVFPIWSNALGEAEKRGFVSGRVKLHSLTCKLRHLRLTKG